MERAVKNRLLLSPMNLTRVLSGLARLTVLVAAASIAARADVPLDFSVERETVLRHDDGRFLWYHPRAVAVPGDDPAAPAMVMTLQQHLQVSDYYSGIHVLTRTSPRGDWTGPAAPAPLAWRRDADGVTLSVADVTPGWHAPTGRVIAIGAQVRYSSQGKQLEDVPRAHQTVYAVLDPQTGGWSAWRMLEMPPGDDFNFARSGCAQWLVRPDGTLLVPLYVGRNATEPFQVAVAACRFDGTALRVVRVGPRLSLPIKRGLYEPSLAAFAGRYFLTLRNDLRAYVAVGDDGVNFGEPQPWRFDDGEELGSYNTQAHWVTHREGIFLVYTRRGAANDHIVRHRAPLFMARVDPVALRVVRASERVVVPERGAELGNFGANAVTASEAWVTVSEGLFMQDSRARGADGSTFVARIRWSRPDRAALPTEPLRIVTLGDSITKAVRPGVTAEETFATRLERSLRRAGVDVTVRNVGIGGERTDQALLRLERDVLAHHPHLVTIMYGTNDSYVDVGKTDSRISAEAYRENLLQLIDRLRAVGVTPVLMTAPRWGRTAKRNGVGENPNVRLEPFVEICRDVAVERRVALVDHYADWSDAEGRGEEIGGWTTDQCHPNPEGQARLAGRILPVVREALGLGY
jgi:lysophospholipase L1-like esterase